MTFQHTRANVQAPEVVEKRGYGGDIEKTYKHPAFGQFSASRVSVGGRGVTLYGSEFPHHSYIALTLTTSTQRRDLSRDWYHNDQHIVKFALSESQWATFVSSLNVGGGVPATLEWLTGQGQLPELPPIDRRSDYAGDLKNYVKDAVDELKSFEAEIDALGLSQKKTKALKDKLLRSRRLLDSTIPFVESSFNEHMEEVVEKSKQEVHGYIQNAVNRAGIQAIAENSAKVLSLE